jgi:enamine deaminase RidA (YjgF/YER057c/UK114 family)
MIGRFPGLTPTRSRAVVHDDLVFTVAVAPDPVTPSMYEQSVKALARIDESLKLCGSDKSKILTAIVYISDMKRKGEMNRAWDEWSIPKIHRCAPASGSSSNRRISWRSW